MRSLQLQVIHGGKEGPTYNNNLFSVKQYRYNLTGSGINQPPPSSRFGHCSFSYIGCRLWNCLPHDIRDVSCISNFGEEVSNMAD